MEWIYIQVHQRTRNHYLYALELDLILLPHVQFPYNN